MWWRGAAGMDTFRGRLALLCGQPSMGVVSPVGQGERCDVRAREGRLRRWSGSRVPGWATWGREGQGSKAEGAGQGRLRTVAAECWRCRCGTPGARNQGNGDASR